MAAIGLLLIMRMNKICHSFLLIFLLMLTARGSTQIVLDRQVISSFGVNVCDQYCLFSTAGQTDYITVDGEQSGFTSGFEQPDGQLSLSVVLYTEHNACDDSYVVTVQQVSECGDNDVLSYFWNNVQGDSISPSLSATASLQIFSSGGCVYSAQLNFANMVITEVPCTLEFFSFISPNEDGDNDQWLIKNIDFQENKDNEVRIMNRWGAMVWQAEAYDNVNVVWEGKDKNGEILPDGTYFYFAKINGREYNGYVELIR
jgi:gliding motility-associated-like protein